jgi:AcrR family transcriptional regulator
MEDKKVNIYNCGEKLFSSKGFKNTNVADITEMAGVGVGTFYNYYTSKDQLFVEIFMKENEELKKSLEIDQDSEPIKAVLKLFSINQSGISTNPILKEWYNNDLYGKLEKLVREQGDAVHVADLMNSKMLGLIKKWKTKGKIRYDLDDGLILAILNAISYIDLHKEEIGLQYFPQIIYYFTRFMMEGLTDI